MVTCVGKIKKMRFKLQSYYLFFSPRPIITRGLNTPAGGRITNTAHLTNS